MKSTLYSEDSVVVVASGRGFTASADMRAASWVYVVVQTALLDVCSGSQSIVQLVWSVSPNGVESECRGTTCYFGR